MKEYQGKNVLPENPGIHSYAAAPLQKRDVAGAFGGGQRKTIVSWKRNVKMSPVVWYLIQVQL